MADDLAVLLGKRYIERRDVKAVQYQDGHYQPDKTPWKLDDIRAHLAGDKTYGHYLVSPEGNCRLFAFDIDLAKTGWWSNEGVEEQIEPRKVWLDETHPAHETLTIQLRCLAEGLAVRAKRLLGLPVAVASSGSKGLHVYVWTGSMPAEDVRGVALDFINDWECFEPFRGENFWRHKDGAYPNCEIEVFPKQDSIGADGFGNLLRLPLGVNRKTGQWGFFVDLTTPYNVLRPASPGVILANGATW